MTNILGVASHFNKNALKADTFIQVLSLFAKLFRPQTHQVNVEEMQQGEQRTEFMGSANGMNVSALRACFLGDHNAFDRCGHYPCITVSCTCVVSYTWCCVT